MVVAVRGRVGTVEPLVAEQSADEGVMLEQVRSVASELNSLSGHSVPRITESCGIHRQQE